MGRSFDPLPSGQIMIFPGWWYTYPSEKYESQLGLLFRIYGKIKAMFQTTNQILLVIYPINPCYPH